MEFPLASAGLRNETLRDALRDMLGKPFRSANIVYVPTASMAEPGDHGWLLSDMHRLHIDDDTALRVSDGKVDVLSEGRWRFHP